MDTKLPINQRKAKAILSLYEDIKPRVTEITRSQYTISAPDRIFSQPIFNSSDFIERSGIPGATTRRILRELRSHGVLDVVLEASGRRSNDHQVVLSGIADRQICDKRNSEVPMAKMETAKKGRG